MGRVGWPRRSAGRDRRTAAIACLILFLLPFAGIGVITAVQAVRFALAGDLGQAGLLAIFALVFGGVGIGGILAAVAGGRRVAERDALRARHPESPWLWRDDWAAGRIEDSGRGTMRAAWAFAAFWNLVSLPGAVVAVREAVDDGNRVALLALVFPAVGLALLIWAVRATMRYRRYGVSVLELAGVPAEVGHGLVGAVRTTGFTSPAGFDLALTCVRRVTRGSGKQRSTSESVLWQEERRVQGRAGLIPVAFPIPPDAAPADERDPNDQTLWRLRVTAEVPGVDYDANFDVPVFRTARSADPRTAEEEERLRDPLAGAEYRQPPESRIRVSTNRRGTEILFPAARNAGAAAGLTLFLAIWLGSIVLMVHLGAPWFFPLVFGLFALLLVIGVLDLWLGVSRIVIDGGTVTVGRGYLAPLRERRFPVDEIREVTARIGMQAGGRPYYDLTLVRSNGRRMTAGPGIRDKREAEWLVGLVRGAIAAGK